MSQDATRTSDDVMYAPTKDETKSSPVLDLPRTTALRQDPREHPPIKVERKGSATPYDYQLEKDALDFFAMNQNPTLYQDLINERFQKPVEITDCAEMNALIEKLKALLPSLRVQFHRYGRIRTAIDEAIKHARENYQNALQQLTELEEGKDAPCRPGTAYHPQLVRFRELLTQEYKWVEQDYAEQAQAHTEVAARIVHAFSVILSLRPLESGHFEDYVGPSGKKGEALQKTVVLPSWTDTSESYYKSILKSPFVRGELADIESGVADVPWYDDGSPDTFGVCTPLVSIPLTCDSLKALSEYFTLVDVMGYADLRIIRYLRCDPRPLKFKLTKEYFYPMATASVKNLLYPTYGITRALQEVGFVPICNAQDYYAARVDKAGPAYPHQNFDVRVPLGNLRMFVWANLLESLGEGVLGSLMRLLVQLGPTKFHVPRTFDPITLGGTQVKIPATQREKTLLGYMEMRALDHDPVALTMLENFLYLNSSLSSTRAKYSGYKQAIKYCYIVAERRWAGVSAEIRPPTDEAQEFYARLEARQHLTGLSNIGLSARNAETKCKYFLAASDPKDPDHFPVAGYYCYDAVERYGYDHTQLITRDDLMMLVWRATFHGHPSALQCFLRTLSSNPVEDFYWRMHQNLSLQRLQDLSRDLPNVPIFHVPIRTRACIEQGLSVLEAARQINDASTVEAACVINTRQAFSRESIAKEILATHVLASRETASYRPMAQYIMGTESAFIKDKDLLELHARLPENAFALGLMFERGLVPPDSKLYRTVLDQTCEPFLLLPRFSETLSCAMACYLVAMHSFKDRRAAYRLAVILSRLHPLSTEAERTKLDTMIRKVILKVAKPENNHCFEWAIVHAAMDEVKQAPDVQAMKHYENFSRFWAERGDLQRILPKQLLHAYRLAIYPSAYELTWCQEDYAQTLTTLITTLTEKLNLPGWAKPEAEIINNPPPDAGFGSGGTFQPQSEKQAIELKQQEDEFEAADPYTPREPLRPTDLLTTVKYPQKLPMFPVLSAIAAKFDILPPAQSCRGMSHPLGLNAFVFTLRGRPEPQSVGLFKSYRKMIAEEFGDTYEETPGWHALDNYSKTFDASVTVNPDAVDVLVKKFIEERDLSARAPYLYVMLKRKRKDALHLSDEFSLLNLGRLAGCPFAKEEFIKLRCRALCLMAQKYMRRDKQDGNVSGKVVFDLLPIESEVQLAEESDLQDLENLFYRMGRLSLQSLIPDLIKAAEDAEQIEATEYYRLCRQLLSTIQPAMQANPTQMEG